MKPPSMKSLSKLAFQGNWQAIQDMAHDLKHPYTSSICQPNKGANVSSKGFCKRGRLSITVLRWVIPVYPSYL